MSIDPLTVLTSAAVASIVTAFIGQIGPYFDRRQKKELAEEEMKKLIFTKAIELTLADRNLDLEIAKATKTGGGIIPPAAVTVTKHFEYLNHIYNHGTVPDEVMTILQDQVNKHNARPIKH